jgi:hypothetical protein
MLRHPFRTAIIAGALLAIGAVAAIAGNTTFFTSIGDLVFPFTAPSNAGATPGTIDNMTIGATTPQAGTFGAIRLDSGTKTATAAAGAATLNKDAGIITSEAITTAAGATYTLTLTDSSIAVGDQVMASVSLGAGTGGTPTIASVTPAAGSVKIVVQNIHATVAFNAAIQIAFVVFKN